MGPQLIVQTIAGVASILRLKLQDQVKAKDLPSESLLIRAIQRLLSSKMIPVDSDFEQMMAPAVVTFLLEKLASNVKNPRGILTKSAIEELLKICLGTPTGEGTLFPRNRTNLVPKKNASTYEYLYYVDKSTLPNLEGIDEQDFLDILQSAWNTWEQAIPNLTVNATTRKSKSNMRIGFVQLDGVGEKLAEATLRQPGTREYRLEIDAADLWTPSKLFGTLIHEIGHTLGIDHIPTAGSIMYFQADPTLVDREFKSIKLTAADKAAIPAMWT